MLDSKVLDAKLGVSLWDHCHYVRLHLLLSLNKTNGRRGGAWGGRQLDS